MVGGSGWRPEAVVAAGCWRLWAAGGYYNDVAVENNAAWKERIDWIYFE